MWPCRRRERTGGSGGGEGGGDAVVVGLVAGGRDRLDLRMVDLVRAVALAAVVAHRYDRAARACPRRRERRSGSPVEPRVRLVRLARHLQAAPEHLTVCDHICLNVTSSNEKIY